MKSFESSSKMESPNEKEVSLAQKIFMRGIFRVSETNDLEAARQKEWRFDGGDYSTKDRDKESTNYLVFEKGEERLQNKDGAARRCTICHQPLKYVNLIGISGQVVQMGNDCTAKLQRFVETGEIVAENPERETWDEQSAELLDAAGYNEEHAPETDPINDTSEGADKLKKRKIIASMMTWLADHSDDDQTPENIRYASRSYNNMGLLPSKKLARELGEYYKVTRKFLPAEILNKKEFDEFNYHPHRRLLRKVANEGLVQDDIQHLKRIIERGEGIKTRRAERQRTERERAEKQQEQEESKIQERIRLYEQERDEKIKQEKEQKQLEKREGNETETSQVIREQLKRQQEEQLQFEGHKRLEDLCVNGTINKRVFRDTAFVDGIRTSRPYSKGGVVFANPDRLRQQNLSSFEIDKGGAIHVYELDQSPIYGTANALKYFVTIGNPIKADEKYYPNSVFKQISSEVWGKEGITPESSPVALMNRVGETSATDQTILRYSCAQVIVNAETNEPIFMLKDGPVSLEQLLKEYEIVEVDTQV